MKVGKQFIAALLVCGVVGGLSTPLNADTFFSRSQDFYIVSDGWSVSCVFNMAGWELWNTWWVYEDFSYTYTETWTDQWTRHFVYDFESAKWDYCLTQNLSNW